MSYQQGYEDGVRATKAEFLKLHKEEIELKYELLEALEDVTQIAVMTFGIADQWPEEVEEAVKKARKAIAKARGES